MNIEYVQYLPCLLLIACIGCYSGSVNDNRTEIPTNTENTNGCNQKDVSSSLLDVAVDIINKAKNNLPTCDNSGEHAKRRIVDCADIYHMGYTKNGVYKISPINRVTESKDLDVYCDMETDGGGWTLIQRRGDFGMPKDYFYKEWKSYKEGFGDIVKEFWLGNDNIFALTNQKLYTARFDLQDVEKNQKYAQYGTFWIDDENQKYTLHISDFRGDAGDSMTTLHDNMKFTTKDQDNDNSKENCAHSYKGGWWYNACHHSNLNGLYHKGKHESFADGINWHSWKHYNESLESTEIKIRPRSFKSQ